ncbi:vasoactive intestinal polypeptide receptor-like [Macrobrachium nipponense]|uniref:vasoactive intestinal polypeptide receptor-like n=1 Tax=Macrobrachium nipponense TaxID=159736 RepID=UPI0030C88763
MESLDMGMEPNLTLWLDDPILGNVTQDLDARDLSPSAQKCLGEIANTSRTGGAYCDSAWDTLHCWPSTLAGTTAKESCANIFTDVPHLINHPDAFAFRECDARGQWLWDGWTNYSECLSVIDQKPEGSPDVVEAVGYITFVGALLSLSTLLVTLFIFTYFRALECDRLRVHRNLVVSLIIRFVVMLVLTEPFVSQREKITYRDVDWLCKTLLGVRMYAQMSSINWMFVEGLYLHSRLTSNIFNDGAPFMLYYAIGWGTPLLFIPAWAATMYFYHPVHCWKGYGSLTYVWILVAPMVIALMVNFLFLINIIRIMVTRLRPVSLPHRNQFSPRPNHAPQKSQAQPYPLLQIPPLHNRSLSKSKTLRFSQMKQTSSHANCHSPVEIVSYKSLVSDSFDSCVQEQQLDRRVSRSNSNLFLEDKEFECDCHDGSLVMLRQDKMNASNDSGDDYVAHSVPESIVDSERSLQGGSLNAADFSTDRHFGDGSFRQQGRKKGFLAHCKLHVHTKSVKTRIKLRHFGKNENFLSKLCRRRANRSETHQMRCIQNCQPLRKSNQMAQRPRSQDRASPYNQIQEMPLYVSESSCGISGREGCSPSLSSAVCESGGAEKSLSHSVHSSFSQRSYSPPSQFSGQVKKLQNQSSLGFTSNRPEFNIRKAIKATLILFPLLGITNLLFAINPRDKGRLEGAYMVTNALLQTSQGILVSVLYCFLNTEVQSYLRKRWRRYRLQRLGFSSRHCRKNTRSTIVLSPTTFSLTRSQCATSQSLCTSPAGPLNQSV